MNPVENRTPFGESLNTRLVTGRSAGRIYIGLIFAFALLGRLVSLEYTNLTDPTEARYSTVAQSMALTGNWLTPMIPMPEGVVPYLGKPPLHFWFTAMAYKAFGVDEWTSRLPSLVESILLTIGIFLFTKLFFGRTEAWAAALVFLSSGMTYVVAGASVTDMTLTLMVAMSSLCFYCFIAKNDAPRKFAYLAAAFAGLGFLCKGPVSIVLIGLPFLLWSFVRSDFSWMKRTPWIICALIFMGIVLPWFILNEIQNPGFIKYFVWNENIARYLFKDYGDRYGSGHIRPHGISWAYLGLAFMPWTLVLGFVLGRLGKAESVKLFKSNSHLSFLACAALITPLFFTFVRQLHMLYILPAVPSLSILTAVLMIRHAELFNVFKKFAARHGVAILLIVAALISLGVGSIREFSLVSIPLTAAILLASLFVLRFRTAHRGILSNLATSCLFIFSLHLMVLVNLTPYLNSKNSSESALTAIANDHSCDYSANQSLVGIVTENTFSHYWTAGAWATELPEKLTIKYVPSPELAHSDICYFLVEAKSDANNPELFKDGFKFVSKQGSWIIYARNQLRSHLGSAHT